MTKGRDLQALCQIAAVLRDQGLGQVAKARLAYETTLERMDDLQAQSTPEMDPFEAARMTLSHQVWAEPRRKALQAVLAQQVCALRAAETLARTALGRAEVLDRLRDRARTTRPRP